MTDQAAVATLYVRLGGYDAFAALNEELFAILEADPEIGRFWKYRSADSIRREKQLALEYNTAKAGGPSYYIGRDLATAHKGMGVTARDWAVFLGHLNALLDKYEVPQPERSEMLAIVEGARAEVVDR